MRSGRHFTKHSALRYSRHPRRASAPAIPTPGRWRPCFTALEPIRERYQARFGDELCWCCPIPHDGYSGCVLLPVKEGILYFAYNEVDGETYEQFDLQSMGLLTQSQLEELRNGLRKNTVEQFRLLSGIQSYGPAQKEEEYKDTAVQRVLGAQNLYLLRWGRPTESDCSINDINRELIQAMADENDGQVYLGSFHLHLKDLLDLLRAQRDRVLVLPEPVKIVFIKQVELSIDGSSAAGVRCTVAIPFIVRMFFT